MLADLSLQEYSINLQPRDHLLLFSDGVPDAVNHDDEPFGNRRLVASFTQAAHLPADDCVLYVADAVAQWTQGVAAFDDLTLLVVEVEEQLDER